MSSSRSSRVLVLAAGAGSRMGGPKALMSVGGRPWWRVQSERLKRVGFEQVWLVSPEVRAAIEGESDAPANLIEADSAEPMFDTVLRGVKSLDAGATLGVFVQPVDVPVAERWVWMELFEVGGVAVPRSGGRTGHPIYLPWEWVEAEMLGRELGSGGRLDALVRGMRKEIDVPDGDVAVNLNSPGELERWLLESEERA